MTDVLMVSDAVFAADEARLLRRLEIGLVGAGVRPVHLIPESVPLVDEDICVPLIRYRTGRGLAAGPAARRVVAQVDRRLRGEDIELVHVFGRRSWPLGVRLSRMCDAPLLVELYDAEQARAAARLPRDLPGGRPVLCTADAALSDVLDESRGTVRRSTPWGVHAPQAARRLLDPAYAPSVLFLGSPGGSAIARAAVTGIAGVLPRHPDVLLAIEGTLSDRARLWGLAAQLGVQGSVSLVPAPDRQPEVISRADIIVVTNDAGRLRSVFLEAMAHGAVVVTGDSPSLAALGHDSVVTIPEPTAPEAWGEAVGGLLSDPVRAREIGESAHRRMRSTHPVSTHIGAVVDAYEWTLRADAVPLRPPA